MKYIEDYVAVFSTYLIRLTNFDERIALSLGNQCALNNAFTAKQGDIALRLLKKYKNQFVANGYTDLPAILDNPIYKYPFRIVDTQKIAYIDNADKKIKLKFPFDEDLVTKMRKENQKKGFFKGEWNADEKVWAIELNETALKFIADTVVSKNFEISEELEGYLQKYQEINENFEQYIPMLIKENGNYIFRNLKSDFSSDDLMTSLVKSAKMSVHVFDDQVFEEIQRLMIKNPLVKVFTKEETQNFQVTKNDYLRKDLINFAKSMDTTTAIFLDESATAETLELWIYALISSGVDLKDVGVFCRQKNDQAGIKFNTVVKDNGLNKTANDDVKWMFLMTKYPKSLIKNGKIAQVCLFDNKYLNAHHTVRSVVKNSLYNFLHNEHVIRNSEFVVL